MHWQVLGSGSEGNAVLVRTGEMRTLVDCGLPGPTLVKRLEAARIPPLAVKSVDHVAVTHGHLDHARSAGLVSCASQAVLHGSTSMWKNRSFQRAHELRELEADRPVELRCRRDRERLELLPVAVPHDCDPTHAFRLEHEGRVAVLVTDMGEPDEAVARALQGAHLLQLEFNHDLALLRSGPYSRKLKARVAGDLGHLSNEQAARMLRWLASESLHTVVLAHLSSVNNKPEIAEEAARRTLSELGLDSVRIVVADQHEVGPNLAV